MLTDHLRYYILFRTTSYRTVLSQQGFSLLNTLLYYLIFLAKEHAFLIVASSVTKNVSEICPPDGVLLCDFTGYHGAVAEDPGLLLLGFPDVWKERCAFLFKKRAVQHSISVQQTVCALNMWKPYSRMSINFYLTFKIQRLSYQ